MRMRLRRLEFCEGVLYIDVLLYSTLVCVEK